MKASITDSNTDTYMFIYSIYIYIHTVIQHYSIIEIQA